MKFLIVDAFSEKLFGGNPAGIVLTSLQMNSWSKQRQNSGTPKPHLFP